MKNALKTARKNSFLRVFLVLVAFLALPAAWRWTPLGEWVNFETITVWQQSVKGNPAALYLVAAAYVLGGLVFFPVTVLTVATVLTFGPIEGNLYALVGWLLSASVGYGIGRLLGRELLHKMAAPRLDLLIRQAERHGIVSVLTMRLLPVAPFTLVNLFVGASYIHFGDFFFASVVGRIPGIVALTLVGVQFENALRAPDVRNFALLGLVILLAVLAVVWLSRRSESSAASHRYSSKG